MNKVQELYDIYSLMSLAIVFSDWQTSLNNNSRGFNIGCILVNKNNQVVFHGLNSITSRRNATQHGEVRAMTGYLEQANKENTLLDGYTIYTSLEPCAMCAGMMVHTNLKNAVYVQLEIPFKKCEMKKEFGRTLERFSAKTGDFTPYPFYTEPLKSKHPIGQTLENAAKTFMQESKIQGIE